MVLAAGCGAPGEGTDGDEPPLVIGTTPDAGTVTIDATEPDTPLEADSTASSADADEKDVDDQDSASPADDEKDVDDQDSASPADDEKDVDDQDSASPADAGEADGYHNFFSLDPLHSLHITLGQ